MEFVWGMVICGTSPPKSRDRAGEQSAVGKGEMEMLRILCARILPGMIVAALLLLAGAGMAGAQETESQEAPDQAVEERSNDPLLERAKRQYDEFRDRAGDMSTRTVMVTESGFGEVTTTTIVYLKGDRSRVEKSMSSAAGGETFGQSAPGSGSAKETIYIRDGEDVWLVAPGQAKRKLGNVEVSAYSTEHDIWLRIPENARITGQEELGGRNCSVVDVRLRAGEKPVKIWLDSEALVIVGGEGHYRGGWSKWIHSDFREVEGRLLPHSTEFFVNDESVGVALVEEIDVDADLSDGLFDSEQLLSGPDRAMRALYESQE
jgi:hypothetical protein